MTVSNYARGFCRHHFHEFLRWVDRHLGPEPAAPAPDPIERAALEDEHKLLSGHTTPAAY